MNNVLQLTFNRPVPSGFLAELEQVSPHPFRATQKGPDPRDVLTKPEFLDVQHVVVLTFEDGDRCTDFRMSPKCREVYEKHAK